MRQRIFILILCLLITSSLVMAGTDGKIAGLITDESTGEPLIGVNIILEGTIMGGVTNNDGQYFILNIPSGVYSVTARMMGYAQVTMTDVQVRIDQTTTLNFVLGMEVIAGQTVTIVAERPVVELDLTASKEVISNQPITNSFVNSVDE
ncbi:MAG: carboxypeptidase-like regulatory domain-containing protein, partial [Deltaproteobacteria bacterium]|nr:carboxypeptidase-like regulatory domain-containing protein [Deltaproteobacteria bacterium]